MNYTNINPGLKIGMKQSFTITVFDPRNIYFLTHDSQFDKITWNMFVVDIAEKEKIEKILRNYLTN